MPTSCSVRGCRSRKFPGCNLTFHSFPKNPELRKRWVAVTGKKDWTPGHCARLCSRHFEEACFDRTGQTNRLWAGALPTIDTHGPRSRKKQIFLNADPRNKIERDPVNEQAAKGDTFSGRHLRNRVIIHETEGAPAENGVQPGEEVDPLALTPPPSAPRPAEGGEAAPANCLPDHFYCRTQSEMDALLKKSEHKLEYLKMKLDYYIKGPNTAENEKPPPWPHYWQEEAQAKAPGKAAPHPPPASDSIDPEALLEADRQLRENLKEAEELRRQIKTQQQKTRRSVRRDCQLSGAAPPSGKRKKAKPKFIRCVVMIEPTSESGKNDAAATAAPAPAAGGEEDGEEEEVDGGTAKETGASLRSEEVGSLQESILSHTATMVVGHNTQLEKRDKQIEDLQKQLEVAKKKNLKLTKQKEKLMAACKQKEKLRTEQLEHLQEVIEMLKEKCSEDASGQGEPAAQKRCALCRSPLLRRCHQVAQLWAACDVAEDQVSVPLSRPGPAERRSFPPPRLKPRALLALNSQSYPWPRNGGLLCQDCQPLGHRSRWKGRSSLVQGLRLPC